MKLVIVDDDPIVREGLKIMFEQYGIEVLGCFEDARECLNYCSKNFPDIVIMDIRMPNMDGIMGTKKLKEVNPNIKVVLLTTFKDDEYIAQAIKYGADGYILKSQPIESIVEGLKVVLKGGVVLDRQVYGNISEMVETKSKKTYHDVGLSEREFEIIKLIVEGLSNKEIAQKLYISEGTVRNYISNILQKLNLRDRTQIAVFYFKNLS